MSDIALPRDGVPALPLGGRMLGDERLAKLAGRGNERAFAALYERHHQAIYRYCRSILHNDQDAQDAMQSAMTRAYAALRSQERELAVKPWLFRIAHNESISILRKRRPEDELSDAHEHPGAGVEGTLETRERLTTLLADLRALPDRQRGALLMRELSGLSIEQIAGALEISPGAAKQTLFEARNSLHELSEGRAMPCESVREAISGRDGRVLRSRRIRSHLRACEDCREFRAAIATRSADLAALAPPLPASAAGALLTRLLAHGGGHSGSGAAIAGSGASSGALGPGTLGSGAVGSGASLSGHAAAASLLGKGLAGAAALALAAAGTAHFAASSHHRTSTPVRSGATSAGVGASVDVTRTGGLRAAPATSGLGNQASKFGVQGAGGPSSSVTRNSNGNESGQGAGNHAGAQRSGAPERSAANTGQSHQHGQGSGRAKGTSPATRAHRGTGQQAAGRSRQNARRQSSKSGSRSGSSHTNQRRTTPAKRKPPLKAPVRSPTGSQDSPTAQENAGLARKPTEVRPTASSRTEG